MKRTLSLVLALVMILGTFTVFAETTDAEMEAGLLLEQLEVLVGSESGDLMLDQDLQRQQAVVLLSRLMGEEELAENFPVEEDEMYPDEDSAYYSPFLAWARANGTFQGNAEGNFKPLETITNREYAKVLLTALGYKQDVDFKYVEALEFAKDLGIEVYGLEVVNLKRGMMAVMTVEALKVNVKDLDKTLAETLGLAMPKADELEVLAVTADNLKEVVVQFNAKVDPDSVTNANVQVKGQKGSSVLAADGMSVVIVMDNALVNQRNYTAVIENLVSVDGAKLEKTEMTFKAFDTTLPQANEIVVTGPRSFELVFSEPIEKAGNVEVKYDKTKLGNRVTVNGTNRVTVEVFTNFIDEREYTVAISDFKDFAGYTNVVNEITFVYEKDVTPPVAEVVKAEQTHVVVDFNKPVKGLKAENFYHTFNAWTAVGIYKDAAMKEEVKLNDTVTRVYVDFNGAEDARDNRPLPEGNVRFGIFGTNIKDNWGNALGHVEMTISVAADKVVPAVSLEVVGEDKIKAKFNKTVKMTKDNVEILDSEGKKINNLTWTVDPSVGNEFIIELSQKLVGRYVTVNIKNVVDNSLVGNRMPLYTEVLQITDKTAPKVSEIYTNISAKVDNKYETKQLVVMFNEEVDGATALVASNYSLVKDNKVTILTETPYFDVNSARVVLPLTNAQADIIVGNEDNVKLQIINVKDLSGNTILPILNKIGGKLNEATAHLDADVVATATDTLVVEIKDLVSNVSKEQFEIKVGTKVIDNKDVIMSRTDSASTTTLEFKLDKDTFAYNASNVEIKYEVAAKDRMINSFGIPVESIDTADVEDAIAPAIVKDGVVWNGANKVTIEFTEAIERTVTARTFKVEGATIDSANVSGRVVTLMLKAGHELSEVKVTQLLNVYDMSGNHFMADKVLVAKKVETEPVVVTIESIEPVADINVDYGTAQEDILFPETITLNLSNGTTGEVNVTWVNDGYNPEVPGLYTHVGNYDLPVGVTGEKLPVSVKVFVAEEAEGEEPVEDVILGDFTDAVSSNLEGTYSVAVLEAEMLAKFPEATQSDKFRVRTSTDLMFDLEYDTGFFANWDLQGPGYSMEVLNTAIVTMLK